MAADKSTQKEWVSLQKKQEEEEREEIDDLILQNKTMDALIKGLSEDIEIFKKDKEGRWTPADIVRFTMQLNIMRDKKKRNLASINAIVKKHKEAGKSK
jgi:hypothetical protein